MNLRQRLTSAFLGIFLFVAVLFFQYKFGYIMNIALSVVTIIALNEFFMAEKYINNKSLITVSYIFGAAAPLFPLLEKYYSQNFEHTLSFGFLIYIAALYIILLSHQKTLRLEHIAVSFFLTISVSWFFACIAKIGMNFYSEDFSYPHVFTFLLLFLGAWLTDSAAFFTGFLFGKHKLAPTISPKKTVEGAIGGIVITTAVFIIISFVFNAIPDNSVHVNIFLVAILGFICSIAAIFGDLCSSVIKRECNIKDFGSILPGHGGILDRFDSVLFVAPIVLYYISFVRVYIY
jgi:phosphatidate cytidylyltransferase